MSIGLGIFLGSLFIGTIMLYFKTANTWAWRNIIKRMLLGIAALTLIFLIWLVSVFFVEKWENRPVLITSFKNINLDEKYSEVVFKTGFFEKEKPVEGVLHKDATEESFKQTDTNISISVANGKVISISYTCKADYDYTSLNGVQCGDSSDSILKRFESKVRVLCSKDSDEISNAFRVYDLVEYGVRYRLVLNKIDIITVFKPDELKSLDKYNWLPCKN